MSPLQVRAARLRVARLAGDDEAAASAQRDLLLAALRAIAAGDPDADGTRLAGEALDALAWGNAATTTADAAAVPAASHVIESCGPECLSCRNPRVWP